MRIWAASGSSGEQHCQSATVQGNLCKETRLGSLVEILLTDTSQQVLLSVQALLKHPAPICNRRLAASSAGKRTSIPCRMQGTICRILWQRNACSNNIALPRTLLFSATPAYSQYCCCKDYKGQQECDKDAPQHQCCMLRHGCCARPVKSTTCIICQQLCCSVAAILAVRTPVP